ncbi:MAG: hypothetical protein FGM62_02895 [Methylobacterium sp.]|nr:hypothetical protein [Methylobacterium sp.]
MLILLLVIFAMPVLLVVGMYKIDWRPTSGSSYGQLLQPPRPLVLAGLHDARGSAFAAAGWKDKWTMLTIGAQGCPADCMERLRVMRQVHVALNKEIGRVQRVLLLPSGAPDDVIRTLQEIYPDLHVLTGAGTEELARQFEVSGTGGGSIFLVDPLGNWMMTYPRQLDAKGLLSDLQRLLKYSWVG